MNHERIEKVNVSRGKIQLAVKPWEIVTISLANKGPVKP
jgi:hypothetical protein